MLKMVEEMKPEDAMIVVSGAAAMSETGTPDAAAMVKLISTCKGKTDEELAGILAMIPESLSMLRPVVKPLSYVEEGPLRAIMEAALAIQHSETESGQLQLSPILKIQSALKEIPEIRRVSIIEAAGKSKEHAAYREFIKAGSETICSLSTEQLTLLIQDLNENEQNPTMSLWLSTVGTAEAVSIGAWICSGRQILRVLSFLGGLLMFIGAFVGIFTGLFTMHWWDTLLNFLLLLLAVITILIEVKTAALRIFVRRTMEEHMPMIKTVEGRGYFYFFASSLCLAQWHPDKTQILNTIAGCYMFAVAVLNLIVGVTGRWTLAAAKSCEPLWAKDEEVQVNCGGKLNMEQTERGGESCG